MQKTLFEPFRLVIEAHSVMGEADAPAWAEIIVTPDFVSKILHLRKLCSDEELDIAGVHWSPDRWDREDDLQICPGTLFVTKNEFWFEAYPKHDWGNFETKAVRIADLDEICRKKNKKCRVLDGIVFYDLLDPDYVMESYFER